LDWSYPSRRSFTIRRQYKISIVPSVTRTEFKFPVFAVSIYATFSCALYAWIRKSRKFSNRLHVYTICKVY
jgi:hypothetical protein